MGELDSQGKTSSPYLDSIMLAWKIGIFVSDLDTARASVLVMKLVHSHLSVQQGVGPRLGPDYEEVHAKDIQTISVTPTTMIPFGLRRAATICNLDEGQAPVGRSKALIYEERFYLQCGYDHRFYLLGLTRNNSVP